MMLDMGNKNRLSAFNSWNILYRTNLPDFSERHSHYREFNLGLAAADLEDCTAVDDSLNKDKCERVQQDSDEY